MGEDEYRKMLRLFAIVYAPIVIFLIVIYFLVQYEYSKIHDDAPPAVLSPHAIVRKQE